MVKDTHLPTQEQFVRDVRSRESKREKVCAWFCAGFGIAYIVVGLFFFQCLVDFSKVFLQLVFFCSFFTIGILCRLVDWTFPIRCPICGKRWKDNGLAIALHSCPYCHHKIFTEQSLSQIHLPELRSMIRIAIYSFIPLLIILLILARTIAETGEILSFFRWMLISSGGMLLLSPLMLMFSKKCGPGLSFNNKRCPVCGERNVWAYKRYTGNCSVCGSRIDPDWPPPEPEPVADLPTWDEWKKKPQKCPYCPPETPYCTFNHEWKIYGRCPNCRRKLVRDGGDERGGADGV